MKTKTKKIKTNGKTQKKKYTKERKPRKGQLNIIINIHKWKTKTKNKTKYEYQPCSLYIFQSKPNKQMHTIYIQYILINY